MKIIKAIKNWKARRAERKEKFKHDMEILIHVFSCGQRIWRKITELEEKQVYVTQRFDGMHFVKNYRMTVVLKWRGFVFTLKSIRANSMFCKDLYFNKTAKILSGIFGDDKIKHEIWEPEWMKDGITITGLERCIQLTNAMLSDFENLGAEESQESANGYADSIIKTVLKDED